MLPGLRFLIATIVLSVALLIFGLGAAALLRATHENYASLSSWRIPNEPTFALPIDNSRPPIIAMLRAESAAIAFPAGNPSVSVPTPSAPEVGSSIVAADSPPPAATATEPISVKESEASARPEPLQEPVPSTEPPTTSSVTVEKTILPPAPPHVEEPAIAVMAVAAPADFATTDKEAPPPAAPTAATQAQPVAPPADAAAQTAPVEVAVLSDPATAVADVTPVEAAKPTLSVPAKPKLTAAKKPRVRVAIQRRKTVARPRAARPTQAAPDDPFRLFGG